MSYAPIDKSSDLYRVFESTKSIITKILWNIILQISNNDFSFNRNWSREYQNAVITLDDSSKENIKILDFGRSGKITLFSRLRSF